MKDLATGRAGLGLRAPSARRTLALFGGMLVVLAVALPAGAAAFASNQEHASQPEHEGGRLWCPVAEETLAAPAATRRIVSGKYRTLGLDHGRLLTVLAQAPLERTDRAREAKVVMELPWPDGSFKTFHIEESPIMEPELAAQFPELKTYQGQGIADPTAIVRFDWTPSGFHAMIFSSEGTVLIDPYSPRATHNYVVYYARDYKRAGAEPWRCDVTGEEGPNRRE